MARVGINPARGKVSAYRPSRVTLAVLTYIPDLSGYFEQRLQILELVLSSLQAHTTPACDLLVFDNGSCPQVVDYLRARQSAGGIDYLLLSRWNIGKIGALRILFEAAPGEVIAYNDDDILFYPGWLEAHLCILDNYPRAGMVSGAPVRNAALHAHGTLERMLNENDPLNFRVTRERRIPDEWERDWAISTGRDAEKHLRETSEQLDTVLQTKVGEQAVEAIAGANHFQFVAPKELLLQALPTEWSGKLMGHMIELDEAVDNLGYLRLSTVDRYARHLGNTLSVQMLSEAQALGLSGPAQLSLDQKTAQRERSPHWSLKIPGARRLYMALYRRLFDILYR